MNKPLRNLIMEECLGLSREAMVIFDALEAGPLTLEMAHAIVTMGERANAIALGVKTLAITRG